MLEDLVEGLDRAWNALDAEQGVDFALNCFRFHQQLLRDSRTSALLEDLRREESDSQASLHKARVETAQRLGEIADDLERDAHGHFSAEPDDDFEHDTSLAAVRRLLSRVQIQAPEPYTMGKERPYDKDLEEVIGILDDVAQAADMQVVREQLRETKRRLEYEYRARRIFYLTSAAASLAVIERHLVDMHPPGIDRGADAELARLARLHQSPIGDVAATIFGVGNADASHKRVRAFLDGMRSDVKRVYEDVRRRIGTERSLLAVFQRYRQRCQWYEVDRMRAIAEDGRGKPEDRLTETLATYLFDHGLNPLIQPLVGQIRPDLLDSNSRFSFYVEAKQYSTANPGYLLQGMQQMWDMLAHLQESRFDVREAFYVIFRLGGPRYDFPSRVPHGNRVVHVLVIDLAPTSDRGSKAPPTKSFTLADLAPQPVAAAVSVEPTPGAE